MDDEDVSVPPVVAMMQRMAIGFGAVEDEDEEERARVDAWDAWALHPEKDAEVP